MRKGGVLTYMLTDHLGSTSLITNATGNVLSETRYSAWGEVRYQAGTMSTGYTYTGQYSNTADFGLMYYNARWYDPALGRFAQADSIVPAGVQGYDRYAYVRNNPLRYTDPSGHIETCGVGDTCKHADSILFDFGIETKGLNLKQKWSAATAAAQSGLKFFREYGVKAGFTSAVDAFRKVHGGIFIQARAEGGCLTETSGTISCGSNASYRTAFLHEFGHVFENYQINHGSGNKASDLDIYNDSEGNPIDDGGGYWSRTTHGFKCSGWDCLEHPPILDVDQTNGYAKAEQFADLYMNWILDGTGDSNHGFTNASYGNARRTYMTDEQIPWALGLR